MQIKRKYKIAILLLAVTFTAQSCGGGGGVAPKQIDMVWWKPFDDPSVVQPLIQEFEKANPNIRITFVKKSVETYEEELVDALAAGSGPDIFSIHNDWLPKHQDKLVAAPDTVFSAKELRDNFVGTATSDLTSGGKVYGVPLSVDTLALYYNRDILASAGIARPPASWAELVTMTPKLTKMDSLGNFQRSAIALGTADNINRSPDILALLMLQNGTPFYSPSAVGNSINQEISGSDGKSIAPGSRALEFYTQFANPGKVSYTWNQRSNNSIEAFVGGQVGMVLSYSYLLQTLKSRAPFLNYGTAPAPQIDPSGLKVNFANYWAEAVAKKSPNAAAAWKFIKFISGKDVLAKYNDAAKNPSSRIDILEKQQADPDLGVFADSARSAKAFYKPQADAVDSIFATMINDVVLRNVSPAEAVSAAAQKINLLLKR